MYSLFLCHISLPHLGSQETVPPEQQYEWMHCPCLDNHIHHLEHGQGDEGAGGDLDDLVEQDSDQTEANTQPRQGLQPLQAPPPHCTASTSWTLLAGWNILWHSSHYHLICVVLSSWLVVDILEESLCASLISLAFFCLYLTSWSS